MTGSTGLSWARYEHGRQEWEGAYSHFKRIVCLGPLMQDEAKKAVAVAFRNRWRRHRVQPDTLKEEIQPKNILMIGPTGW